MSLTVSHEEHERLAVLWKETLEKVIELKEQLQFALDENGQFTDTEVVQLCQVDKALKDLRLLNVALGCLGGLKQKRIAEIHNVSTARISQMFREIEIKWG